MHCGRGAYGALRYPPANCTGIDSGQFPAGWDSPRGSTPKAKLFCLQNCLYRNGNLLLHRRVYAKESVFFHRGKRQSEPAHRHSPVLRLIPDIQQEPYGRGSDNFCATDTVYCIWGLRLPSVSVRCSVLSTTYHHRHRLIAFL